MNKLVLTAALAAFVLAAFSSAAKADFVCPVLPANQNAVDHNNNDQWITIAGGDISILPGKAGDTENSPVSVPDKATNLDGAGSPGGDHANPGDKEYSAIWNT